MVERLRRAPKEGYLHPYCNGGYNVYTLVGIYGKYCKDTQRYRRVKKHTKKYG